MLPVSVCVWAGQRPEHAWDRSCFQEKSLLGARVTWQANHHLGQFCFGRGGGPKAVVVQGQGWGQGLYGGVLASPVGWLLVWEEKAGMPLLAGLCPGFLDKGAVSVQLHAGETSVEPGAFPRLC